MGCTWCHKNELIYKIKLCIKTLRAYSFLEIWKINFFWCISWKIYHWAAFSKIESFSNIQQILWRRVEVFQTSKTFFLETIFFEVFDMISTSPIPLKVAKNLLHTSLYRSGFGFWQIQIHGIFKNLKTWEQWWKNSFSKLTPFHEFFFFLVTSNSKAASLLLKNFTNFFCLKFQGLKSCQLSCWHRFFLEAFTPPCWNRTISSFLHQFFFTLLKHKLKS